MREIVLLNAREFRERGSAVLRCDSAVGSRVVQYTVFTAMRHSRGYDVAGLRSITAILVHCGGQRRHTRLAPLSPDLLYVLAGGFHLTKHHVVIETACTH
jgi:hypothetical protein